jgi:hypothetical protein
MILLFMEVSSVSTSSQAARMSNSSLSSARSTIPCLRLLLLLMSSTSWARSSDVISRFYRARAASLTPADQMPMQPPLRARLQCVGGARTTVNRRRWRGLRPQWQLP